MKLLPKSIVQSQVAAQRKAQIDEGVLIATKVDTLRQTLANLETQHQQFISGMEKELRERTGNLHAEIRELESHIADLQEKRQELLKPLDTEWQNVREKEAEISKLQALLDKKTEKVAEKEQKLDELLKDEKERLGRIKVTERELDRAYRRAHVLETEASVTHSEAVLAKESQEKQVADTEKELERRKAEIDFNATANQNLKLILVAKEKELNDRERAINDKYATLMRSIERNK